MNYYRARVPLGFPLEYYLKFPKSYVVLEGKDWLTQHVSTTPTNVGPLQVWGIGELNDHIFTSYKEI
jgi:hypothetical protein